MFMHVDLETILGGSGGNWAYFAKNPKLIGEFIRTNALNPVTIGAVVAHGAPAAKAAAPVALAASALHDLGIKGGIRVSHLHFEDKIYLLNAEQWAKFSGSVVAEAKAKLEKAKVVSFEQVLLLGSVAQTMAKE